MSALRTLCKALHISPFGRMEDILARAHTAADDAGLQVFVEQTYWFPSFQELNELIEQVADDDAQYQHNQVQLQHSAWLLSQPPGYESDAGVPEETTPDAPVAHMQFPSMINCAPTNTVIAQPRCELAAEPRAMSMQLVVLIVMSMVVYATWAIMSLIHSYMIQFFTRNWNFLTQRS